MVACARAIGRALAAAGKDFHYLAETVKNGSGWGEIVLPPPSMTDELAVDICMEAFQHLSAKEQPFVRQMASRVRQHYGMSDKQRKWLYDIAWTWFDA